MKEEKPAGRFSDSGGAAAFLCGTDASTTAADAFDDCQQVQEAIAVSRRFPDEPADSEIRHRAIVTEGSDSARRGSGGACAGRGRRRAAFVRAWERTAARRKRIRKWRCGPRPFTRRVPEPLQLSASAIDAYERCPMQYLFQQVWRIRGGPSAAMTFGNAMHTTIKEFVSELRKRRKISFEEVAGDLRSRMVLGGIFRRLSRSGIPQGGARATGAILRELTAAAPPDVLVPGEKLRIAFRARRDREGADGPGEPDRCGTRRSGDR